MDQTPLVDELEGEGEEDEDGGGGGGGGEEGEEGEDVYEKVDVILGDVPKYKDGRVNFNKPTTAFHMAKLADLLLPNRFSATLWTASGRAPRTPTRGARPTSSSLGSCASLSRTRTGLRSRRSSSSSCLRTRTSVPRSSRRSSQTSMATARSTRSSTARSSRVSSRSVTATCSTSPLRFLPSIRSRPSTT
eukprot:3347491-Prymnesium_polylepis.1